MNHIPLINEILLVDRRPLVVLGQVVQLDRMYAYFWILKSIYALRQFEYLDVLAHALLQIVYEMYVRLRAHDDEQDLVLLVDHHIAVKEKLRLSRCLHI